MSDDRWPKTAHVAGWCLALGLVAAAVLAGPTAAAGSAPACSRAAIATERAAGRRFETVVCYVDGVTEWQALGLSLARCTDDRPAAADGDGHVPAERHRVTGTAAGVGERGVRYRPRRRE